MNSHSFRKLFITLALLLPVTVSSAVLSTHTIQFGGTHGKTYFPSTLNVLVGDTIKWVGDLSQYPMQSISVPIGASAFGPINSGDTFIYIVKVSGEYGYGCPKFASVGMTGGFIAQTPHYGLTNEGREFYLGLFYPSFHSVETLWTAQDFYVNALVSSFYENDVTFSYFNESGIEVIDRTYHVFKGSSLKIPLLVSAMQMDSLSEAPAFKSCHITSSYPITLTYISTGACAGGSYLALPVLGLGKNYVAACYNDNPGNGALYDLPNPTFPKTYDNAGGEFMVIGNEDLTFVKITPTTTTVGGHQGSNTGAPHPYTVQLNKGQCYLVRSNGKNADNDLSGSLIESSRPVAVLSGHQNAFLGGSDPFSADERDMMIEQMIPVEYWDSLGYIAIPFAEPTPPGDAGHGDAYRVFCFDSTTVKAHLDVQGISGGYDMTTTRLASPPEKFDITSPAEAYSLDGKKFNLIQYDEKSVTLKAPWPAPSMMSIVPVSRWKTSCFFPIVLGFADKFKFSETIYLCVIAEDFTNITASDNGESAVSLSGLNKIGGYNSISRNFPKLKASVYSSTFGLNAHSYYLSSPQPFAAYYYGIHDFGSTYTGDMKNHSAFNYISEYASSAGMQLNTGVTPSFKVSVDTTCSGWHICVRDTGKIDPGLKAVILIDDPDAIYWQQPGAKFRNVGFEESAPDYYDNSELHPHVHGAESYCFDVKFTSPLDAASAPLAIVDNLGNAIILKLERSASALKLSTNPPTPRADSIVFPVKKIGEQICTTFVFKNTAPTGGTALNLNSANFTNSDQSYKLQSITPALPHSLAPQDSLTLQVCYTPLDSARHRDSLVMKTDCFSFAISLDAHGSTGLISASDLDFSTINVGDTACKDILIKNVGSAPFTVTKSFLLSDSINFSVDTSKLPKLIPVGATVTINVCFHPKTEGPFTAGIDWGTDLEASFAHSIKNHSSLSGQATPKAGVKMQVPNSFSIYPNPANGNSAIVTFGEVASGGTDSQSVKGTSDGLRVRPTGKAILSMFDVLGREVYHQNILSDVSRIEIPLRNIPEGVYYVRLDSPSGSVSQKFVRTK